MIENRDRGKIPAQIVDICRTKIDELSNVSFGTVSFSTRFGNVYRMQIVSETLIDKDKTPRDILEGKTKEELIELLVGRKKEEKGGTQDENIDSNKQKR